MFYTIWGTQGTNFILNRGISLSIKMQAIIAQRNRDASLCNLMETIEDLHSFVLEAEPLKIIESHRKILEDMSRLTVECAYFIRNYTIDQSFCASHTCCVRISYKFLLREAN